LEALALDSIVNILILANESIFLRLNKLNSIGLFLDKLKTHTIENDLYASEEDKGKQKDIEMEK
jgi:hypothetical protein